MSEWERERQGERVLGTKRGIERLYICVYVCERERVCVTPDIFLPPLHLLYPSTLNDRSDYNNVDSFLSSLLFHFCALTISRIWSYLLSKLFEKVQQDVKDILKLGIEAYNSIPKIVLDVVKYFYTKEIIF